MDESRRKLSFPKWLIASCVSLVLLIFAGGYFFNLTLEQNLRSSVEYQISSVALLKTREVEKWRDQCRLEANEITASPYLSEGIYEFITNPTAGKKQKLISRFENVREYSRFKNVLLVDTAGKILFALFPTPLKGLIPQTKSECDSAIRSHKPLIGSMMKHSTNESPHLQVFAPIYRHTPTNQNPLGAIILIMDLKTVLYPSLDWWPTKTRSAETVIAMRDKDSIVFLSDFRFIPGSALRYKQPISSETVLSNAVNKNMLGLTEGKDYRGRDVIAYIKHIGNSDWYLLSKLDESEAFSSITLNRVLIISLTIGLIITIIILAGLVWMQMQKSYYKNIYESEKETFHNRAVLNAIAESTDDSIFFKALDGRYLFINSGGAKMSGKASAAEMIGKTNDEIFSPETAGILNAQDKAVIESGQLQKFIGAREYSKNKFFSFISSKGPLFDNQGKLYGIFGISKNITEFRKIEENLREQSVRLENLSRNIPGIIFQAVSTAEKEITFSYISEGCKTILGVDPSVVINDAKCLTNTIIDDDIPGFNTYLQEILESPKPWRWEGRFHSYGKVVWLQVAAIPRTTPDGSTIWDGAMMDITKIKYAEEELKENEYMLAESQKVGRVGSYYFDVKSSTWRSSKTMNEILGIDNPKTKSFEDWINIIHPEDRDSMVNYITHFVLHDKNKFDKEYKIVRISDGQTRWVWGLGELQFDSEGTPVCMIGTIQDITDRHRLIDEIIKSKETAEEANRVKSSFLANMSHELRTPMNGILGLSEVLSESAIQCDMEEVAEIASNLHTSGKRLMDTLNQILDISKLEAESLEVLRNPIDINSVAVGVISLFEKNASRKNLELRFESHLKYKIIQSDQRLISQILNNLVDNAIKYTDKGEVKLILEGGSLNGKDSIIITVKDTGIGIPEEKQKLIWDEFRQVSEGIGRNFEGTGLGLTLTKKIVGRLGGSIAVKSEVDKGSSFIVELPVVPAENIGAGSLADTTAPSVTPESRNKGLAKSSKLPTVLYVEDDEISFDIVRRYLKNTAMVEMAANSTQAFFKLQSSVYDAILMDINLPKGLNGIEITKEIRKMPGLRDIPIIALTAYAMRGDKEEILDSGCNDYLSKPFEKNDLIQKLSVFV